MKITTCLMLGISMIAITGCSGDSSPAASTVRSQIFSDTAVTAFTQTAGVAKNKPSFIDNAFNSAYAVDGNIRCVEGAPVSFQLDALGNTVQIDTTCNAQVDLTIRQGLLQSMAGKRMLQYWAGGHDATAEGRVLTFNAVGSFWGTYDNIEAGSAAGCKDKLTFDEETGSVTIENDAMNYGGVATNQACLDAEFPGATANDYKRVLPFRFKDGKLQLDGTGTGNFVDGNDLVKICISSAGNVCD